MHRLLLFVVMLWCSTGQGGDFYRQFLSLVDTNQPGPLPVRSPLLLDTNNTVPKLTNAIVNLSHACSGGEIGGVRLAMTMEEVAQAWGKPPTFWGRCFGGPRFWYSDAVVAFAPSSNSATSIIVHKLPRLHGGLTASSSADEFEKVLGKPVVRHPNREGLELVYESPRCILRLQFLEGGGLTIRLDQPAIKGNDK